MPLALDSWLRSLLRRRAFAGFANLRIGVISITLWEHLVAWVDVEGARLFVRHFTTSAVPALGFLVFERAIVSRFDSTLWVTPILKGIEEVGLLVVMAMLLWNLVAELWNRRIR